MKRAEIIEGLRDQAKYRRGLAREYAARTGNESDATPLALLLEAAAAMLERDQAEEG